MFLNLYVEKIPFRVYFRVRARVHIYVCAFKLRIISVVYWLSFCVCVNVSASVCVCVTPCMHTMHAYMVIIIYNIIHTLIIQK